MRVEYLVTLITLLFIGVIVLLMMVSTVRFERNKSEVSALKKQALDYLDSLTPQERIEHYKQAKEWNKRQTYPLRLSDQELVCIYAQYLLFRKKVKSV